MLKVCCSGARSNPEKLAGGRNGGAELQFSCGGDWGCRYAEEGTRHSVEGVLLVSERNTPHVLLVQVSRAAPSLFCLHDRAPQASHVMFCPRAHTWQITTEIKAFKKGGQGCEGELGPNYAQ